MKKKRVPPPRELVMDLAADERRGLEMSDALARINHSRFPTVRMWRAERLARAASRLGWKVDVRAVDGSLVMAMASRQSPSPRLDVESFSDARRALASGGVLTLTPPSPLITGLTTAPPAVTCRASLLSWTPPPANTLASDKRACTRWLRGHGIPVPRNAVVCLDVKAVRARLGIGAASRYVLALLADHVDVCNLVNARPTDGVTTSDAAIVVVKPLSGTGGNHVTTDVSGMERLAYVLARSCRLSGVACWIVEEQLTGRSHRTLVACPPSGAPPRIVCMCERLPPVVVGNGVDSVAHLLAADARRRTPWHPHIKHADVAWMRDHGADPQTCVPAVGQVVRVRAATNWGQGGAHWRIDPTTGVHPSGVAVLCRAASCLPGRPFLVAIDSMGDMAVPFDHPGGPVVHEIELQSGIDDIPGGCDWVPVDESRLFDAILLAYVQEA